MNTRIKCIAILGLALLCPLTSRADDTHGSQIFHSFRLEGEAGYSKDDPFYGWDLNGWLGSDFDKLWIKSEGTIADNATEQSELWAMYSRNVSDFWDLQTGFRQDFQPYSTSYFVFGLEGLAKYFFETEAHLFISDEADVSARLRQENDFLITQRLILQPYAELNLYFQDVADQNIGSGLTNGEFGLQLRYEYTRKFAPYIDLRYERKMGETISFTQRAGDTVEEFIVSLGLRLMF